MTSVIGSISHIYIYIYDSENIYIYIYKWRHESTFDRWPNILQLGEEIEIAC